MKEEVRGLSSAGIPHSVEEPGEGEGEPATELERRRAGGRDRPGEPGVWKPRKASPSRSMAGPAALNTAEGMQVR